MSRIASPVIWLVGWTTTRRFTQITLSTRLETNPRSCDTMTIGHPPVQLAAAAPTAGPRPACRRWPSARPAAAIRACSTVPGRSAPAAAARRRARRTAAAPKSSMPTCASASQRRAAVGAPVPAQQPAHARAAPAGPSARCPSRSRGTADRAARAAACSRSAAARAAAAGRTRAPRPRRASSSPRISFTSVVLPPPLGPTMQTVCRWPIARFTSSSTGTPCRRTTRREVRSPARSLMLHTLASILLGHVVEVRPARPWPAGRSAPPGRRSPRRRSRRSAGRTAAGRR